MTTRMRRQVERRLPVLVLLLALAPVACADGAAPGERPPYAVPDTLDLPETNYYAIETPLGRMVVRLADETPLHRDNFKRLVAEGTLDSTLFHRVIDGFMIQGGDPGSRDDNPFNDGQGGPGYTVPAEFHETLFHRRGALAAARQGDLANPDRASSGSQFYIVQGQVFPDSTLDEIEEQLRMQIPDPDFAFSAEARRLYTTEGGYPPLDAMYTVFGQVVEGFDVLDRIAGSRTPRLMQQPARREVLDRPLQDVWMVVRPLPGYTPPAPTATDG